LKLQIQVALALSACGAVACGPPRSFDAVNASTGRSVRTVLTDLREEQTFGGVYLSPQAGVLWLSQEAEGKLSGAWMSNVCGCRVIGRLHGSVTGNRASFDFTEVHSECEDARRLEGTGFLFYLPYASRGRLPELHGARRYTSRPTSFRARKDPRYDVVSVLTARAATTADNVEEPHCP
jgi:hypothetical protein